MTRLIVALALMILGSDEAPRPRPIRWVSAAMFVACLALGMATIGCATPGPYGAITTTGERLDDGGGECGAVAIDASHVLTARHCVASGPVYFHAAGEADGRRVERVILGDRDIACLVVNTGSADVAVAPMYADAAVTMDGNVSGAVAGKTGEAWDVAMKSQRGDSGSAVRDVEGAVVGLVSKGMDPVNGHATITRLESAEAAFALCFK